MTDDPTVPFIIRGQEAIDRHMQALNDAHKLNQAADVVRRRSRNPRGIPARLLARFLDESAKAICNRANREARRGNTDTR